MFGIFDIFYKIEFKTNTVNMFAFQQKQNKWNNTAFYWSTANVNLVFQLNV